MRNFDGYREQYARYRWLPMYIIFTGSASQWDAASHFSTNLCWALFWSTRASVLTLKGKHIRLKYWWNRENLTTPEFLPPANVVCEGYVFTPVCDSVNRGMACVVAWGRHAWLLQGACVVALGGHGCSRGGMHGCSGGACVVALGWGGVCGCSGGVHGCSGGHAWLLWGGMHGCSVGGHAWDTTRYGDTVNERAVRILLECILVKNKFLFLGFLSQLFRCVQIVL